MNPHHIKTLQLPFQKLIFGAVAIMSITEAQLNLAASEDEANTIAINSWDKFADLSIKLTEQLIAITKGLPCPCESCVAHRAAAMTQAEQIFTGGAK